MANNIELKSISELLGKNFFIPSYQRGYRWTRQQVEDLLNDIHSFAIKKHKSDKEFYCLQPIIVRKCSEKEIKKRKLQSDLDDNIWYEVIDGQQRLTTIRILISYLVDELYVRQSLYERHKKHLFILEYETRKDSKSFLDKIVNSTDSNNAVQPTDDIDFYFMVDTLDTIKSWFDNDAKIKDPQIAKEAIRNTLIYKMNEQKPEGVVQIIWYETEDINPIDTFIRINMGKIPLTNAELIKALFLQEKNFGNKESANLHKVSIAKEWDTIEYALQDEDFWWFLNRNKNDAPARIEFLFDLIRDIEKKQNTNLTKEIGTDEHATFRLFYNKFLNFYNFEQDKEIFEKVKKQWDKIKDYFSAFDEWYNHPVWYHYIGFLIYAGTDVVDIYNLYKDKAKDKFTQELKTKIQEVLSVTYTKDEQNQDTYNINLTFSNNNKSAISKTLLLYNIQYIVNQYIEQNKQNDSAVFIKFPFKLFKNERWDIEHIDSFTTNSIEDKATATEWLETSIKDLGEDKIDKELLQKINDFIGRQDKNIQQFDELRNAIVEIAGENENNDEDKNSIGNLTLLDAGTNRSYGNALFPTKRRMIIEKDSKGTFIPVCTKNVFLKNFAKEKVSLSKWTRDDIINYQNHIGEILEEFLTINTTKQ
jgi:uncharacterized protein with ParB-like and HNH nuclease domain